MINDLLQGAVLPPVVMGVVVKDSDLLRGQQNPDSLLIDIVAGRLGELSIIDGMQRTTALLEANAQNAAVADREVRVEFWVAEQVNSLVYRMLVLNTGQVPWSLSHQLEVVYKRIVEDIERHVTIDKIATLANKGKRTRGGQYTAHQLVECYIAFGARKTEVDTAEKLADEFSKLDVTEALGNKSYDKYFYNILQVMVDLDIAFSRLDPKTDEDPDAPDVAAPKLRKGRHIFDRQPARVGFIVAAAVYVLGRLGNIRDPAESERRRNNLLEGAKVLLGRLSVMEEDALSHFLAIQELSERLGGQKRSAVGRYEREYFERAFGVLIEDGFNLPSLRPCWFAS